MSWALYALAALTAFGALANVLMIGKPRKPTTPGGAALTVVLSAIWVITLVIAARRLS